MGSKMSAATNANMILDDGDDIKQWMTHSGSITDFVDVNPNLLVDEKGRDCYEEYKCPLCLALTPSVIESDCGHIYCTTCRPANCSLCRKEKVTYHEVLSISRKIKDVRLNCIRAPKCAWAGQLQDWTGHCNFKCELTPVECVWCHVVLARQDMLLHSPHCVEREQPCPDCKALFRVNKKDDHRRVCPSAPIDCENKCGALVERKLTKEHRLQCPLEAINCQYQRFGCSFKGLRKECNEHMAGNEGLRVHLDLALQRMEEIEVKRVAGQFGGSSSSPAPGPASAPTQSSSIWGLSQLLSGRSAPPQSSSSSYPSTQEVLNMCDSPVLAAADYQGLWFPVQVEDVQNGYMTVHYLGFERRYDEKFEVGSARVRAVFPRDFTPSLKTTDEFKDDLRTGAMVDARSGGTGEGAHWQLCEVIDTDPNYVVVTSAQSKQTFKVERKNYALLPPGTISSFASLAPRNYGGIRIGSS